MNKLPNPFSAACAANITIPFGMLTMRGLGGLVNLVGVRLDLDAISAEVETVEAQNQTHILGAEKIGVNGEELPMFSKEFFEAWAASPLRESWKGAVKDTGREIAHGLMTLGALRGALKLFHSGKKKFQKSENAEQQVVTLFRSKKAGDPEATRIAGRMKYLLGNQRGSKDKAACLSDETLIEVYVWVNPDEDGWFRANLVLKAWYAPDAAPAELEMLTHEGKPIQFNLQVIEGNEEGQTFEVLTLEPEWLIGRLADLIIAVEAEQEAKANQPSQTAPGETPNEKFADRA